MKRLIFVTLTACGPLTPPTSANPPSPSFDPFPDVGPEPHPYRVITRTLSASSPSCLTPQGAGWTGAPMFAGGAGELARYCLYVGDPSDPLLAPGPFSAMAPTSGVIPLPQFGLDAVYDRVVLRPAGTQPGMAADFYARFREGAGVPDWALGPHQLPGRPRIAFLDSSPLLDAPDVFQTPGDAPHGFLLAHLTRELACHDGVTSSCYADVASRPALTMGTPPWPNTVLATDPPEAWEGAWGTIGMLAQAVHDEVRAWSSAGAREDLILNLSVAWHPYFDGGITDGLEILEEGAYVDTTAGPSSGRFFWAAVDRDAWAADVHAVFDALQYARCEGALAVAAAGNRTGGVLGQEGPMLPAAWAAIPPSELPACTATTILPVAPSDVADAPLLWAVGGVDVADAPLVVARPRSTPHLLAYGDHAISSRGPNSDDLPLTGTSVSTAIVTATAALVWAADPSLTPLEVMRTLYDKATSAGPVAGPYLDLAAAVLPGQTGDARVVRACEVMAQVDPQRWRCASLGPVPSPAPVPIPGTPVSAEDMSSELPLPGCGLQHYVRWDQAYLYPAPFALCPMEQYFSPEVQPWTYPQPQGAECPFCFVDLTNGILYLEFDRPLSWFDALTVTMLDPAENQYHYTLPGSVMTSESSLELQFNPANLPPEVDKARLTMVKNDTSVTTSLTVQGAVPTP